MQATDEVLYFIVTSDAKNSGTEIQTNVSPTSVSTKSRTAIRGPVTAASLGALSSCRYSQSRWETPYKQELKAKAEFLN